MSPNTFARLRRMSAVQVLAGATGTPRRYQGVLAEYAAGILAAESGVPVTGATVAPPEAALSCDGAEAWLASLSALVPPAPVPVQAAEVPDLSARLLSDAVDRLLALADAAVRDGKI